MFSRLTMTMAWIAIMPQIVELSRLTALDGKWVRDFLFD
jgi:hypothetical protein